MRWWKIVGLAGVVSIAAVGIAAGASTVRGRGREFVDADIDELRERLHRRFEAAQSRRSA